MQFIVVSLLNNATSWIIIIIIIINVRPSLSTDWMIVPYVIKHHVEFREWRSILPSIPTKCPVSSILGLRHISYLVGAQTGTWSGDVKTPTTVQEQVKDQLILLPAWISFSKWQLETVNGEGRSRDQLGTRNRTWMGKVKYNVDGSWLDKYVGGEEWNQSYVIPTDQVWFCSRIPGHLGIALFIDDDTDMNNSRGRKRTQPSAGLSVTCLSRGRKWHPPRKQRADKCGIPFENIRTAVVDNIAVHCTATGEWKYTASRATYTVRSGWCTLK
jgi:hypothetical protein